MKVGVAKRAVLRILEVGEAVALVGHAGVGKTALVREIAEETGRDLEILILSQMEPGDLIGLPSREGGRTVFLKPDWWPESGDSIVFLDELNRAHRYIRYAVMQLIIDRRIHNHFLPEGTWIVAAMNPTEGYDVFDIEDPAFVDRFVWLSVENDLEDFTEYIKRKELYIDGLEEILCCLRFDETSKPPNLKPTPRSIERALRMIKYLSREELEEFGLEVLSGTVGKDLGKKLWEHALNTSNGVIVSPVEEILGMPKDERLKILGELSSVLLRDPSRFFELVEKLSPEEGTALLRYASKLYASKLKSELEKRKDVLKRLVIGEVRRRVM